MFHEDKLVYNIHAKMKMADIYVTILAGIRVSTCTHVDFESSTIKAAFRKLQGGHWKL